MRPQRASAIMVSTLWLLVGVPFAWPAAQLLEGEPIEVFQGEIVELKLSGTGLTPVEAQLGKNKIRFYPAEDKNYAALIGIDLETKPGMLKVVVKGATKAGIIRNIQLPIRVKTKSFQQESFSVAPQFDDLGPDLLERIRQEQQQLDRVFATFTPERMWERPFIAPVSSDITSPFGYRRIINGTPRAPHTGVDLRAPLGTQVLAANHGRIALTGDFFFSGKSVVLDHGGGLYTMYFHLSELKVDEGAEVSKGDVIGLSGMTGRVTGPHLHWGARINGARVDPFQLIEKLQPAGGADANPRTKEE
jgi:murein DD-endopeptidase MepM/ murein hydrolase activator NlpD